MMPAARAPDPEAALVARSVVWRALETLDPRRRAVLVMHELEGTPVDVIARTLGVTSVTVRWHLSKGRRQLARQITVSAKGASHERVARLVERRDPVVNEPPLSDADVQRMRQAIVAAADESHESSLSDWARGSWAAATVVIALTIAVEHEPLDDGRLRTIRGRTLTRRPRVVAPEPGTRRQVQLIAPGGTRVIWIFNADFKP